MDLRVCERCSRVQPSGTVCPGCSGPLTLADATFFLGREFGKYRVERLLGVGGMGVVFAARHALLQRPAAIKVIQPAGADEGFLKRFLREAQVLAELKHPNIVEVYDFDVSPWGPPYYVMEYLEGSTLREVINRRGRDLSLADFAPLLRELVAALAFAHAKGVVHRDLKPENIFIATFGGRAVAKVLDFGIAKLLSDGPGDTHLTASGAVMGTPNYLAPEQILLQPVGPATDQYALALVVAEMISGRAVRAGKSLGEICSTEIRKPLPLEWSGRPDLFEAVRQALHRATQPDPASRFPSIADFFDALQLPAGHESGGRLAEAALSPATDETSVLTPTGRKPRPTAAPLPPTLLTPAPAAVSAAAPPPTLVTPLAGQQTSAPAPRRRFSPWAAGLGLLLLTAAGLGGWRLLFLRKGGGENPARRATAAPTAAFEEAGSLSLPPDAKAVVGYSVAQRVALVLGPDCIYLLKEGVAPARVQLDSGAEVLGSHSSGDLFLRQGGALVRKDFFEGTSEVLLPTLPPVDRCAVTPSGRVWVGVSGGSVVVRPLEGDGPAPPAVALGGSPSRWTLGERQLVALVGEELVACDLRSGSVLWRTPSPDPGVRVLALDEAAGLVAAGGQFDRVHLFGLADGRPQTTLTRKGWTAALAFLPDGTTLLVSGDGGLSRWVKGRAELEQAAGAAGDSFGSLRFTGRYLWITDGRRDALRSFAVRLTPVATHACTEREVWALAAIPDGTGLFIGGADGSLHRLDPATGAKTTHPLHSQGVTALVAAGRSLASSSDDKTITIWGLPEMAVQWRSKAHDFLINGLCLAGSPSALWSSSSDGSVKRWAWPGLEVQESLGTEALLGRRYTLAAVWASDGGDRLLVGTWDGALLDLTKDRAGTWGGKALPVPNECLYSVASVPSSEVVLLGGLGGRGAAVYAYDLRRERLLRLDDLGLPLFDAIVAPLPGAPEAWVGGAGGVLHYAFSRGPSGELRYEVRCAVNTDLGLTLAATALPEAGLLATGDEEGKVHFLELRALRALPAYDRVAE